MVDVKSDPRSLGPYSLYHPYPYVPPYPLTPTLTYPSTSANTSVISILTRLVQGTPWYSGSTAWYGIPGHSPYYMYQYP